MSDKKAKMGASFVIGNEPSKSWDLSTILSQRWVTDRLLRINGFLTSIPFFSTLNVAYDQIIASIVDSAQNHIKLADELNSQVVEVLKGVERKNEESKKKVSHGRLGNSFFFFLLLHSIWMHGSRNCISSKSCLQTVIAVTPTDSRFGTCHFSAKLPLPNLIMSFVGRVNKRFGEPFTSLSFIINSFDFFAVWRWLRRGWILSAEAGTFSSPPLLVRG